MLGGEALDSVAKRPRFPFQPFGGKSPAHSVTKSGDPQCAFSIKKNSSRPDPDFCLVRRLLVAGSRDGPYGPRCFGHPQLPVGCLGDLDYVTYPNARGLKHLRSRWQKDQRVLSSDPKRSLTIEKNCLSRLSWEIPILPDFFPSVTFEPRFPAGCGNCPWRCRNRRLGRSERTGLRHRLTRGLLVDSFSPSSAIAARA